MGILKEAYHCVKPAKQDIEDKKQSENAMVLSSTGVGNKR